MEYEVVVSLTDICIYWQLHICTFYNVYCTSLLQYKWVRCVCVPVRYVHPSFWAHTHNKALRTSPHPSQLCCFLFFTQKNKNKKQFNAMLRTRAAPRAGLYRNKMLSFRLKLMPPAPREGLVSTYLLVSFHWTASALNKPFSVNITKNI